MSNSASIVIIKRNGGDGPRFPLHRKECLFGRDTACDLRVQLPGVALEHAKVVRSEENSEFYLENLIDNETMINGKLLKERVALNNMDVFSIAERSFRFESNLIGTPKTKGKSPKEMPQSPKRVSQSSKGSPLQEVNRLGIKDSPRTPQQKRVSLRESMGKLRRASVPFQEEEENMPNSLENWNSNENHQVYVVHSVSKVPPKRFASVNTPKSTKKSMKRVSFGPMLSPEQFDKELPVITPVRKGGTPRRLSAPLSKSCISPSRRRYSVAASSFVSKIDEEKESDSDEERGKRVGKDGSASGVEFGTQSKSVTTPLKESREPKRKKLATPLREEIERGKKLRERNKKIATPLKNAIKQGFRLKTTKKKLQTPLRNEIEVGMKLRQTKKKLATPIRKGIEDKPSLRPTRQRMPTPVRKAIEAKPLLTQTKKMMSKDLQKEITNGITLRKTKKTMPEKLQEEIKAGRKLKTIKRRMKTELQKEIIEGKELRKRRKKIATPVRQEIAEGVNLRMTKRRMPTMLQNEIKTGAIQLTKTKRSLKTPLRKEIERGMQLRNIRTKDQSEEEPMFTRTPKRRLSSVDDGETCSQAVTKKLKTPSKTPRKTGFFPSAKSRNRSVGRRKSRKQPSYAEVLKRSKLTAKRRLSSKQKNVYQFQVEQQVTKVPKAKSSAKTSPATSGKEPKLKAKTPNRRKSQARGKTIDDKKSNDEWTVVVNKRKIKRIKRQRAAKSHQATEDDIDGVDVLFKTPKAVRTLPKKNQTRKVVKIGESASPTARKSLGLTGVKRLMKTPRQSSEVFLDGLSNLLKTPREKITTESETPSYEGLKRLFSTPKERCSRSDKYPDDSMLYGVARLMKSPKFRESPEVNYEGVPELFEVFEMSTPIDATYTPSLRKATDKTTVVFPLTASKTPSLRKNADKNEVMAPLLASNTPSLRNAAKQVVVVTPMQAKTTPSLKKPSETVTVMSPIAKTTSEKIQVESPDQRTSCTDSTNAVTITSIESTSTVTNGGRATRSKRKIEQNSLPVAKRPRRRRVQGSLSEKTILNNTEPPKPRCNSHPVVQVVVDDEEVVDISLGKPTTRGRRQRTVTLQKNDVKVKPRGKRAAPSDFTESDAESLKRAKVVEKTRLRHAELANDDSTQLKQPELGGAWKKRSTRSLRTNPTNATSKEETNLNKAANKPMLFTPKTASRSSRKTKNVAGIPETPQPLVITKTKLEPIIEVPTPASFLCGSTVTPSQEPTKVGLRSRSKSSQQGLMIVQSTDPQNMQVTENKRTSRSRRKITSIVEETVAETKTKTRPRENIKEENIKGKQVENVAVTTRSSRSRRRTVKDEVKNEEQESEEVCRKRSGRRAKVTSLMQESKVDESNSQGPVRRTTRASKNHQIEMKEIVERESDGFGKKRTTGVHKVTVEFVEEQSCGSSGESQRITRSRTETKSEEKGKEYLPDLKKRPRHVKIVKKDENETSNNESKDCSGNKRITRSANNEKVGMKKATSKTLNMCTSKSEEKASVSPVGRVTRSRRSAKNT